MGPREKALVLKCRGAARRLRGREESPTKTPGVPGDCARILKPLNPPPSTYTLGPEPAGSASEAPGGYEAIESR